MSQRRKRSAAITLVLAGTLTGCGEPVPQRDVYTSLDNCRTDWGQQQEGCEPVRDGRFSGTWFYGPPYFGETWPSGRPKSSANAVEAVAMQQAAAGTSRVRSTPSTYWSHNRGSSGYSAPSRSTSSSSSSSSTSRGGFGSSARSSSS